MALNLPIYLDHNSTTPVHPQVLDTMLPYFSEKFGNAASKTHRYGWVAADAVNHARQQIADAVHCEPGELVFTSGATESVNLAIKGVFERYQKKGRHIVTVATEHKAVLDCCKVIEQKGGEVTYLPVDKDGLVDLQQLSDAIRDDTVLVSVMLANNETGVIQPLKAIADIAHEKGSIMMSDATQALGKLPLDVQEYGIDLMPLSAHKFYGPKGVGALFVRRKKPRVSLTSQIDGGGHQKGLRSGTLNATGIIGMGKAAELAAAYDTSAMKNLRDQLERGLLELDAIQVNGHPVKRLPNTLNVSFTNIDSQVLMKKLLSDVAISAGSACTSAVMEPSHVLAAMGLTEQEAYASVRFSLGQFTTQEEIDHTLNVVRAAVQQMRADLPV